MRYLSRFLNLVLLLLLWLALVGANHVWKVMTDASAVQVDWYPWGEEAFARARAEDKPIFLSGSTFTCV